MAERLAHLRLPLQAPLPPLPSGCLLRRSPRFPATGWLQTMAAGRCRLPASRLTRARQPPGGWPRAGTFARGPRKSLPRRSTARFAVARPGEAETASTSRWRREQAGACAGPSRCPAWCGPPHRARGARALPPATASARWARTSRWGFACWRTAPRPPPAASRDPCSRPRCPPYRCCRCPRDRCQMLSLASGRTRLTLGKVAQSPARRPAQQPNLATRGSRTTTSLHQR
mmetsp:Transcript_2346/g.9183  ORF Transcript_2346/g.9183 Transcript_2346/m.9183 type:complete len:229 (+) Transcript_2346:200-886(+)